MEETYEKAYTQVAEILKKLPPEENAKIPREKIKFYEDNSDKSYKFVYDEYEPIENQKIFRKTNAILVQIFNDYFCSANQREKLNEILKQNTKIAEQEKKTKYENDANKDIFYNKKIEQKEIQNQDITKNVNLPIEIKKENFITKIINFIKRKLRK